MTSEGKSVTGSTAVPKEKPKEGSTPASKSDAPTENERKRDDQLAAEYNFRDANVTDVSADWRKVPEYIIEYCELTFTE